MPPDFSIIIVNLNAAAFLKDCLESIQATRADVSCEVILVDNGSKDGSLAVASETLPDIRILPQTTNIGYVPANNIGLRIATGRFVMFLNNDTRLLPGCLPELRSFLDANPNAGVVSPQILNEDGSDQGCARSFPTAMNGLFGRRSLLTRLFPNNPWSRRYMICRNQTGDAPFEVEILSAACLIAPRDLATQLGGFDESFRLYWVCAEFCHRARGKGTAAFCVPRAKLIHYEGKGGSTKTFRQRCRATVAFNRDAYLAYIKVHGLGPAHPGRLFAGMTLTLRTLALLALQVLRPTAATSSGGRN